MMTTTKHEAPSYAWEKANDAAVEHIKSNGVPDLHDLDTDEFIEAELPDDWAEQVFSWLWDNNQAAVENRDDQGACPSEEEVQEAARELGWFPDTKEC